MSCMSAGNEKIALPLSDHPRVLPPTTGKELPESIGHFLRPMSINCPWEISKVLYGK